MILKKSSLFFTLLLVSLLLIAGCSADQSTSTDDNTDNAGQQKGGVLNVALTSQPPTLDQHISTTTATRDTSRLMFETLLTNDSGYQAVPMLAESIDVSDDSKIYTFKLREGIKFHNGDIMTADDVIASMNRWIEKSPVASPIFDGATFEAEDEYTVILELAQSSSLAMDTMASAKQAAAIMPKEIIETAAADTGVVEYIGTGPYKFVEWKQDQNIHFTKFDDYQSVDAEANGLAGKKEALVDDIYFHMVSDSSTRLSGLLTGEYDFAYSIPADDYDQLKSDPDLEAFLANYGELLMVYNENEGPASNVKMRQAINAALDIDKIMLAAFPHKDLYWLSPGYMTKEVSNWASDAGEEFYDQKDPEKAKELLKEINYNNEEFKLLTTRDYPEFYSSAIVIQEQLKQLGMNVKIEVYDWPTLLEKQNNPGQWDAMIAGSSTVTTPTQLVYISPSFAGGMHDEKIANLLKSIGTSTNHEEAKVLWDELQGHAWENHVPITILGGYNNLYGATNKVKGIESLSGPIYWNVEKTE